MDRDSLASLNREVVEERVDIRIRAVRLLRRPRGCVAAVEGAEQEFLQRCAFGCIATIPHVVVFQHSRTVHIHVQEAVRNLGCAVDADMQADGVPAAFFKPKGLMGDPVAVLLRLVLVVDVGADRALGKPHESRAPAVRFHGCSARDPILRAKPMQLAPLNPLKIVLEEHVKAERGVRYLAREWVLYDDALTTALEAFVGYADGIAAVGANSFRECDAFVLEKLFRQACLGIGKCLKQQQVLLCPEQM